MSPSVSFATSRNFEKAYTYHISLGLCLDFKLLKLYSTLLMLACQAHMEEYC